MDIAAITSWLQSTPAAEFIIFSSWAFPLIEAIHVIGIALVFGIIAIVDLRLLGLASNSLRVTEVARDCLHWTWLGFAIAVVTGFLMFMSNATVYLSNGFFLWKMFLLLLAGINMMVFEFITARSISTWDDGTSAVPLAGRLAGFFSLAFWLGVIATGRWIGFTLFELPF